MNGDECGWVDEWMGGWVDGWMGDRVDGWMGGWVFQEIPFLKHKNFYRREFLEV
jgi:hypothetical protein